MKLNGFEVHGLLGREGVISSGLNPDINIVTGRNGAGKTTLLKLLWYIISGNIRLAIREIEFERATVDTDKFICTVIRYNHVTCEVELNINGEIEKYEDIRDSDDDVQFNAEDLADKDIRPLGSSVFFPTFRRIEGGFSLTNPRSQNALTANMYRPQKNDVEEALVALSRKLSNSSNVFVSSISTVDIVGLLLRQYTDLSEISNELQKNTSQSIIDSIKTHKAAHGPQTAEAALDRIASMIENMERERDAIMSPIGAVQELVGRLFRHTGIKIGSRLSFGDAANAVNSDTLSAGEKQMLSFICYNAFYKDSVIFIDEPELSLHVDWQRQLLPIMGSQGTSNQFVIATHSPFIYTKYPDKEVVLEDSRGDEGE